MSLRPVGTEFWYQFPIPMSSTQAHADRFLYRIVRHRMAQLQNGTVGLLEEAVPIDEEKVYPESCSFCECGCGKLVYQFPVGQARQKGEN